MSKSLRSQVMIHFFKLYRGLTKSHIYYNLTSSKWILESLISPGVYLTTNKQLSNQIPFGTHQWVVADKSGLCKLPMGSVTDLTLSSCFPNKYTCNSGHCIPLR